MSGSTGEAPASCIADKELLDESNNAFSGSHGEKTYLGNDDERGGTTPQAAREDGDREIITHGNTTPTPPTPPHSGRMEIGKQNEGGSAGWRGSGSGGEGGMMGISFAWKGKGGKSPMQNKYMQAMRHPKEDVLKPARWDTHSWLPLLPASGLFVSNDGESLTDVLGFKVESCNKEIMMKWSEGYLQSVAQQRMRWMSFLDNNSGEVTAAMRKKLKSLVRMGVPPELRHRVWRLTTGSYAKEKRSGVAYDDLLNRYVGVKSPFDDQIAKDLGRTLPHHQRYASEEGQLALGRVLRTYAIYQPTVGYCQGMNFLCGVLLLIMSEDDAFWLLAAIVEDVLPGFYHPSLIGVNTDTNTLHNLVAIKLPGVWDTMEALKLERHSLCSVYISWFMCLFNQLPSESMLRVWDLVFFEGAKALFRVSLGLLQMHRKKLDDLRVAINQGLIEEDVGADEALVILRDLPTSTFDCDKLVATSVNDISSLPRYLLHNLRIHNGRRVLSHGKLEEVFVKQSHSLLHLCSRADDNTRKTLVPSNRGAYVWSGDDSGVVCIWDSQTGTNIKRMMTPSGRRVCSMAVSGKDADGCGHVWVGCHGGVICTYDTITFELWAMLPGHTQDVLAIAAVGNSMWTAAGHIVWVWQHPESSDPQVVKELNCVGRDILSLLACENGALVVCGSIAGFVVLDAKTCETIAVGSVDEGITDVVEVSLPANPSPSSRKMSEGSGKISDTRPRNEVWCVHGSSVLGCWDTKTFSSGRCNHVGTDEGGKICGLTSLPNGQVWMGSYDGRVTVWNSKNKRVIRKLGGRGEPVSSMISIVNHLLGVLTVWVAHYDGSVVVWVASDLDHETLLMDQFMRQEWKVRKENLSNLKALRDEKNDTGCLVS